MEHTNWAHLCRMYRKKFRLKQDAFAQDFNVSQPTVSRWEAGLRIPDSSVQARLLDALGDDVPDGLPIMSKLALGIGPSFVAVVDRSGALMSVSPKLQAEITGFSNVSELNCRLLDDLIDTRGLTLFALERLEEVGFFDERIPAARISCAPLGNPKRIELGGSLTLSVLPCRRKNGIVDAMVIMEHEVLRPPPPAPELQLLCEPFTVYRQPC
jgi:transcriptional regulator with XRE-family HTH domain